MAPLTCLAIAEPDEEGMGPLADVPGGVTIVRGLRPEDFAPGALATASVILVCAGGRARLEAVLRHTPAVRWVHSRWAGVETMLYPELAASPIVVTNGRGVYARSLAEFVLASVLYFAKDFRGLLRNQAARAWQPYDVREIHGQTLGIVGYGEIGRAVARLVRPAGMRVLATRRRPELSAGDPLVDEVFAMDQRAVLMSRSDFVLVATPLTPDTRDLIGSAEIAAMKPNAVLINVGRGPVVSEDALVAALRSRTIAGAALDVFDQEPLASGHPFYALDNVLISPHWADRVPGWLDAATRFFVENLERFVRGDLLLNVVDKVRGY